MNVGEIIKILENYAPPAFQESYDNAGLLTGNANQLCAGILCTLDVTEAVVLEAIANNCNLIVAHHPIIFSGLKKINGNNYIEKTIIAAIKNDIAIYAIHTNLDNVYNGVSKRMADKLGLQNCRILDPKTGLLKKLYTYVPIEDAEKIRSALFAAGAGNIGNYNECSFSAEGIGTFKPQQGTHPYIGKIDERSNVKEVRIEVVFPAYLQRKIVAALLAAHPYEEVAYDIIVLANEYAQVGSGIIGELPEALSEAQFLRLVQNAFHLQLIKHTPLLNKNVKKVALCGGAGSFLIKTAAAQQADFYITSDIKYHEFFDANDKLVIADIGHWESEQFTIDLLIEILQAKFTTFAVLKTKVVTNPVRYFAPSP